MRNNLPNNVDPSLPTWFNEPDRWSRFRGSSGSVSAGSLTVNVPLATLYVTDAHIRRKLWVWGLSSDDSLSWFFGTCKFYRNNREILNIPWSSRFTGTVPADTLLFGRAFGIANGANAEGGSHDNVIYRSGSNNVYISPFDLTIACDKVEIIPTFKQGSNTLHWGLALYSELPVAILSP